MHRHIFFGSSITVWTTLIVLALPEITLAQAQAGKAIITGAKPLLKTGDLIGDAHLAAIAVGLFTQFGGVAAIISAAVISLQFPKAKDRALWVSFFAGMWCAHQWFSWPMVSATPSEETTFSILRLLGLPIFGIGGLFAQAIIEGIIQPTPQTPHGPNESNPT